MLHVISSCDDVQCSLHSQFSKADGNGLLVHYSFPNGGSTMDEAQQNSIPRTKGQARVAQGRRHSTSRLPQFCKKKNFMEPFICDVMK